MTSNIHCAAQWTFKVIQGSWFRYHNLCPLLLHTSVGADQRQKCSSYQRQQIKARQTKTLNTFKTLREGIGSKWVETFIFSVD